MTRLATALAWAPTGSSRPGALDCAPPLPLSMTPRRMLGARDSAQMGPGLWGAAGGCTARGERGDATQPSADGGGGTPTADRTLPVWTLGPHRLICGDSTDSDVLARLLVSETVDVVIGEPPSGATGDVRETIARLMTAVTPHAGPAAAAILYAHIRQLVSLVRAGAACLADPARGRSLPRMPAVAMMVHAQANPAHELEEALTAFSPEAAVVLDPFARTDAVLRAAHAAGRRARLVWADLETCRRIAAGWSGMAFR